LNQLVQQFQLEALVLASRESLLYAPFLDQAETVNKPVGIALGRASFPIAGVLRDVGVALRVGRLPLLPGVLIAQGRS